MIETPGVDAAPAAENVCAPDSVLAPLFSGIVAPEVPVFCVAAVPKAEPLVLVQVVATAPADVVQSPVNAGICAAGTVPLPRFDAFKLVSKDALTAGSCELAFNCSRLFAPVPTVYDVPQAEPVEFATPAPG